ncbi:hypothetical protein [Amycolatopsis palatopharyngis]|uniref:hypothetical protein n=1 Tax=Amycolatopsis palatopharyngis TaxID=187982 RepID=UPI000E277164|nr:hypothetical protein [Amycolatopsis palatopharyngis]
MGTTATHSGIGHDNGKEWRRDLVTSLLGVWLVGAVFSDGWAHFNVPELESFFTPWHLALYSGFTVTAGWIAFLTLGNRQPGVPVTAWPPYGYRAAVLGVVVFGVGGVTDLAWHEIFGIEIAVDALVSPSHLLLGAGGLLILTSPLRAQRVLAPAGDRYPTPPWTFPSVLSLVLTTALVAFFLLYTSPFSTPAPVQPFVPTPANSPGHQAAELPVIAALAGYLVATVTITVPFLLMLRSHAGLPRGGVTLLVTTVAGLSVAVVDFPPIAVAGAIGAAAGAVVVDVALRFLRVRTARGAARPALLGALAATTIWSGQLVGLALADALRWPPSLWLGLVVLSAFTAAALGLLVSSSNASGTRSESSARPSRS